MAPAVRPSLVDALGVLLPTPPMFLTDHSHTPPFAEKHTRQAVGYTPRAPLSVLPLVHAATPHRAGHKP